MSDKDDSARRYAIWGSAGHAKVLADLIALRGGRVAALFDNNPQANPAVEGLNLHIGKQGFEEWRRKNSDNPYFGAVAIGGDQGEDRLDLLQWMETSGLELNSLIHPNAKVALSATVEAGVQILANATVASGARVSKGCIINHGAIVDHETELNEGVHIAPGAVLTGCITVERCAFIGAGAVVLPRLRIGAGSIVGAGAVVTKDVPPGSMIAGVPARLLQLAN